MTNRVFRPGPWTMALLLLAGLAQGASQRLRHALKPEYDRFVALAGIDDNMIARDLGQKLAIHSSVVFRVFVDGVQAAESPVMRVSQEPWRFDVPIPPGSRYLRLACMAAGTRHPVDLGNWAEGGFVLKEGEVRFPAGSETRASVHNHTHLFIV